MGQQVTERYSRKATSKKACPAMVKTLMMRMPQMGMVETRQLKTPVLRKIVQRKPPPQAGALARVLVQYPPIFLTAVMMILWPDKFVKRR